MIGNQNKLWRRVSRKYRCPICRHDSWCCVSESWILCMRESNNRPAKKAGWLYPVNSERVKLPPKEPDAPVINCGKLLGEWGIQTKPEWIRNLASKLSVSAPALKLLGCVWAGPHKAWAFPMRDGYNEIVGIRLRAESGAKWAVKGSHEGLFIPQCNPTSKTGYICEGPTDTAAALTLGMFAIGRPSCEGGNSHIPKIIKRFGLKEVVVISDNDKPGLTGAGRLANQLSVPCCTIVPPAKDLREFVKIGGTMGIITELVSGMLWDNPMMRQ